MENNKINEGCRVKFYDCDRANKDRDYSGKERYYSEGVVIKRRLTETWQYDSWLSLGGQDVVDIQLPDGRMSYGHFVNGVKLVSNGE